MKALRKMQARFCGMVRKDPKPDEVAADFSDKSSLRTALNGVDAVFLACAPVPNLVELESNMIDACVECGVQHVVQLSALGAGDYDKSFPAWHQKVEYKLKGSGIDYTILRPNGFFQNITAFYAPTIRTQGAFYASMGAAKVSFLDVRDVGAAAAAILVAPVKHARKIYELFGPESMSYAELADHISKVTGRAANYVDIPEEALRKSMLDMGMPVWQVDALIDLQAYYIGGKAGTVNDVLRNLLGRPPISVDDFLSEYKQDFLPG